MKSTVSQAESTHLGRRRMLRGSLLAGTGAMALNALSSGTASAAVPVPYIIAQVDPNATAAANSTAINSAITSAVSAKGQVLIPGGTFAHQGITFPATGPVTVRGTGWANTILVNTHVSNASVAVRGSGTTYCPRATLSDLTLSANGIRANQTGIDVLLSQQLVVQNVQIDTHGIGVRHQASWEGIYLEVAVHGCGTGWYFPPPGAYTASAPVNLTNCSAINSAAVAVKIDDGVEALTWQGGDFSGSAAGMTIDGSQTRTLSFHSLNFERIAGSDIVIGAAGGAPSAISFYGCRFLRTATGASSVRLIRADPVAFFGCRWTNYVTAIQQDNTTGEVTLAANGSTQVTNFLANSGKTYPRSPLMVSHPTSVSAIGPAGTLFAASYAMLPPTAANAKYPGGTLQLPNIYKTPAAGQPARVLDADFTIAPVDGSTCLVFNTLDGSIRHAVRDYGTWRYSAPYTA